MHAYVTFRRNIATVGTVFILPRYWVLDHLFVQPLNDIIS